MWPYQSHRQVPQVPKGYPLAPFGSWFSVVVPIARTNVITNPSFEVGTTSWTAIGGSIARSAAQQYHGAYSLAITPSAATTDGARYDTISLTATQLYAYSAKVLGVAGKSYKLCIETTGGAELASVSFTATGRWQWVSGYWQETSSTTRRLTIRKNNHASTAVFYLDGVQVEAINAGEYVSTYIDGDQLGLVPNQFPAAYLWSGTPHASQSVRSGQTRAGGMVMRLDYYGFLLLSIVGLGLITPNNVSVPYVQLDGAQYERTQKPPRQFTLAGRWDSATFPNLQRQISALGEVLDRDYVGQQQPLTLLYQGIDDCGRVFSDVGRIVCSYQGGLEGTTDNLHSEQVSIVMRQWLPLIQSDGESGVALTVQQSVASADNVLLRTAGGVWQSLGGANGTVRALAFAPDGKIYAAGNFTTIGGVAATRAAYYDGTAWNAMGSGLATSQGLTIAIGPDGLPYFGGAFTSAGGVANTASIAKWNGSTWVALGTGTNGTVNQLAFDGSGNLYAGGTFTLAGGVANTQAIAKWNGSAWSAMATGANASVTAVAVGPGKVYISGGFTSPATNYAQWNGSAWSAMSGGIAIGSTSALSVGPTGQVYAAGGAVWNGNAWALMSGGGLSGGGVFRSVFQGSTLWIGGLFTAANGIALSDALVAWNGSVYLPPDVDLPGSAQIFEVAASNDGRLAVGYNTTGTATSAAVTSYTNPGTAKTYPIITIKGPSSGTARIYQILNITTGRSIYLNYTINAGETARMVCDPSILSFTSDFQGNLVSTIMTGSSFADFFLQPGVNNISFYSADATVTATLTARPQYNALGDLTP